GGQGDEGIQAVGVLVRERPARGVRSPPCDWDVGVLGEEERVEAPRLRLAGQPVGGDGGVSREHREAQFHSAVLTRRPGQPARGPSEYSGPRRRQGVRSPSMTDEEGIRRTLALYCQLCDDGRFDEWADLYTEDAVFRVMGGEHRGPEAIKAFIAKA